MEADPSIEFDYLLAEKLHMTVAEMMHRVSAEEYLGWCIYYGRKAQRAELEAKRGR